VCPKLCPPWPDFTSGSPLRQAETKALSSAGISLIKERVRDPMPQYLESLRQSFGTVSSLHIVEDSDNDLLIVQGQIHFYRISTSTGRIERASDGAVLELNWRSLPDQFRLIINRQSDSAARLRMQAFMLMNDGVFARYFT